MMKARYFGEGRMDKEVLFANYRDKLQQIMSLMEILLVLPFDGAAIIHR